MFSLCAMLVLAQPLTAQEYYGLAIEDGGVAFLLDISSSMNNTGEQMKAAAAAMLRGLAEALKIQPQQTSGTPAPVVSKMEAARKELLHALDSLRDGTTFTIITFGNQAVEWPAGVRIVGPAAKSLAREYVSSLTAVGSTPMAEALQLGFESKNVRTLFVVTDGRPNTPVLDLVKQLQESRVGRRMVINTVGIGRDQDRGLLCQLALDNEGVYVRDGVVACTFSPCGVDDGVVTFYPPEVHRKRATATRVCSSAEHPDCTPELVYETLRSEARFQAPTHDRRELTNCLQIEEPHPATIVVNPSGLEATTYTRPGNPFHPSKVTRIAKQVGDDVVIETSGAGKGGWGAYDAVDAALIAAVRGKLAPVESQKPQSSLPKGDPQPP